MTSKLILTISFSLLFAFCANAWTIFSSKESDLKDKMAAGNKFMTQADAALDAGNLDRAGKFYERALEKYRIIERIDPLFLDGIVTQRIEYCAEQYTNILESVSAAKTEGDENESAEGAIQADEDLPAHNEKNVLRSSKSRPEKYDTGTDSRKDTAVAEVDDDEAAQQEPPEPAYPKYDERNFGHDFNEAKMHIEDGNLSEAAAVLIPMLRHDPSNRQVRLLIAIVRTRQGRFDEAIMALEDLRGRREDLPLLLALSGAYMGALRYHDALLALDSAVRLNPADPNAYMNLAWLTMVMPGTDADMLKNAEIYYRQAIKRGANRDRALEKRIGIVKW